ncbi:hypothetical protein GLOIN_2v1768178 [Rhizophagus clarus]|uniref:Uncharacterized protein n=1 Tax=Rhizophagus clarus TaxID=94130 RepID=A0A8H3KW73_9GLOM|nr:hypothetical protein GLOIN_2v1768178 [Rhizophagus clarus]
MMKLETHANSINLAEAACSNRRLDELVETHDRFGVPYIRKYKSEIKGIKEVQKCTDAVEIVIKASTGSFDYIIKAQTYTKCS